MDTASAILAITIAGGPCIGMTATPMDRATPTIGGQSALTTGATDTVSRVSGTIHVRGSLFTSGFRNSAALRAA